MDLLFFPRSIRSVDTSFSMAALKLAKYLYNKIRAVEAIAVQHTLSAGIAFVPTVCSAVQQ